MIHAIAAAMLVQAQPIPALVVTGQNNHNWQYTSRLLADTLDSTGRFRVAVTDDPATDLARPGFLGGFKVIVLDYNDGGSGKRWGSDAEANFLRAVSGGTGVVAVHAANNAFKGWDQYEKMLGLMWREGAGHGRIHEFEVEFVQADHPVLKGLPAMTAHRDELYHGLTNPQKAPYALLARAMSSKESGGTGAFEPMAITLAYGDGRVFATPLGHVWTGDDASKEIVCDPNFKALIARAAEWAATGEVTLPGELKDQRTHNTLTPAEAAEGWSLMFDGTSLAGWHAWGKKEVPGSGWSAADGCLTFTPGKAGGDIASDGQFGDFELTLEWKVGPGGNSGIMYRATEDHGYPWETGRECQVLDNARHADGKKPKTRAGCMYDMFAAATDVARPAGEWNRVRIIADGTRLEHWLNGFKIVDVDTASDEYAQALAASKFTKMPDYGLRSSGHIALQDHGDMVWFRNIKVRALK